MTESIESRMARKGIELPVAAAPAANYVPWVVAGNLVFISGQLPMANGTLQCSGVVGDSVSVEAANAAARHCALNLLAQLKAACGGDLGRVRRVVKLGGFVASAPEFTEQHLVMNGASEVMVDVFGEAGRHARFAVGAPALPLGAAVEVDGVFEILT